MTRSLFDRAGDIIERESGGGGANVEDAEDGTGGYGSNVLCAVLNNFCGVIRTVPATSDGQDAALQKEAEEQTDVVRLIGLNILSAALETLGTPSTPNLSS